MLVPPQAFWYTVLFVLISFAHTPTSLDKQSSFVCYFQKNQLLMSSVQSTKRRKFFFYRLMIMIVVTVSHSSATCATYELCRRRHIMNMYVGVYLLSKFVDTAVTLVCVCFHVLQIQIPSTLR